MTWQEYPDVDDAIHDWLKSLYTPYRSALVDPSIIPAASDIDWDTYWAGTHTTSFMVVEDITNHINLGLGVKMMEFDGIQVIRVTYRWIKAGKPPALKGIREFVTKVIHSNITPLPVTLSNAGIRQMVPMNSKIFMERNQSAQQDFWTLEFRVATKVLNTIA